MQPLAVKNKTVIEYKKNKKQKCNIFSKSYIKVKLHISKSHSEEGRNEISQKYSIKSSQLSNKTNSAPPANKKSETKSPEEIELNT